jgi:hypothetical protein
MPLGTTLCIETTVDSSGPRTTIMPHGPEHHLEEAEHAQHSAHNPFDRRVTLSMAIVAALLACVTMLSHRAHNQTLQHQIQSNDNITERANKFAYYHAKKNRQLMSEDFAEELDILLPENASAAAKERAKKAIDKWTANAKKWKADSQQLEKEGKALGEKIKEQAEEAHKYHHRADFFDYGELGIELALILCSIALLTKSRGFWLAGIVAAAVGCAVALSGFVFRASHEEHPKGEGEEVARLLPGGRSGAGSVRGSAPPAAGLDERVNAQDDEQGG